MKTQSNQLSKNKVKKISKIILLIILFLILCVFVLLYTNFGHEIYYTVCDFKPITSFTEEEKQLIENEIGFRWPYIGDIVEARYNDNFVDTSFNVWIGNISDKDMFINDICSKFDIPIKNVDMDISLPSDAFYPNRNNHIKADYLKYTAPNRVGYRMWIYEDSNHKGEYVAYIVAEPSDIMYNLPSQELQDVFWQKNIKRFITWEK